VCHAVAADAAAAAALLLLLLLMFSIRLTIPRKQHAHLNWFCFLVAQARVRWVATVAPAMAAVWAVVV